MRDNTSFVLKAAAFDVDFERGKQFGLNLCMDEDRLYPDYQTMFAEEAKREDGIEAVDIATPNFLHYEATKAALEAGLHVICEKPLFFEAEQGEEAVGSAAYGNSDVHGRQCAIGGRRGQDRFSVLRWNLFPLPIRREGFMLTVPDIREIRTTH